MFTLKMVLRMNALSCICFGIVFLLIPSKISNFLATEQVLPTIIISIIGLVLIINAIHLVWTSFKTVPSRKDILYFSLGDFAWVLATLILITLEIVITTTQGIISSLLVATMVGCFGLLQFKSLKQMEPQ